MKSLGVICFLLTMGALVWIGVRSLPTPIDPLAQAHGVETGERGELVSPAQWSDGRDREEIKVGEYGATAVQPGLVTVHATVQDLKGLPLAAVQLAAVSVEGAPSAYSDAEGEIALDIPWNEVAGIRTELCFFRLQADGLASTEARLVLPEPGEFFLGHFTMRMGGALEGRVIDADGIPLRGAAAYCIEPSSTWSDHDRDSYRIRGIRPLSNVVYTDEEGEYKIEGVALSTYSVAAHLPGMLRAFSDPIAVHSDMTGAVPDLIMEVPSRDLLISGSVLDRDGKPLRGVPVQLTDLSGGASFGWGETDAAGAFSIVTEAGSLRTVRAEPKGYPPVFAFDVRAGTEGLVLRPQAERTLSIRVRTVDGRAPEGLAAHASFLGGSEVRGSRVLSEDGTSLKLVVPQRVFTVAVTANSYETFRTTSLDPEALPGELEIVLEPVVGLVGYVQHEGRPFNGAQIDGHVVRRDGRIGICGNGLHDRFETSYRLQATSGPDGRFVLAFRPDILIRKGIESVSLHATAPGFAQGVMQAVELVPGAPMPEVSLELIRGGSVEGRVIAEEGRDLRGLAIAVSQSDLHYRQEALDALGRFCIENLSPGPWRAVVGTREDINRGARSRVGSIEAGENEWSFSVTDGETTPFRLVLDSASEDSVLFTGRFLVNGASPVGWTWEFPEREDFHKGRLDPEGRFKASLDKAGPRSLHLNAPRSGECGSSALFVQLDLVEGSNDWSYDLSTAALHLTGLPTPVDDPDERLRRYEQLSWQHLWDDDSLGLAWHGFFHCAPEGGLRLAHVPAGSLTIQRVVNYRVVESSVLQLELSPGEVREVELKP